MRKPDILGGIEQRIDAASSTFPFVAPQKDTKSIVWRGNPDAKIMIIGMAPGKTEHEQGKAFVGSAGRNLVRELAKESGIAPDNWDALHGFVDEHYFITNSVFWYQLDAHGKYTNPSQKQIKHCLPFLAEIIDTVRPDRIVTLGGSTAKAFRAGKRATDTRRYTAELDANFINCRAESPYVLRGTTPTGALANSTIALHCVVHSSPICLNRPAMRKEFEASIAKIRTLDA